MKPSLYTDMAVLVSIPRQCHITIHNHIRLVPSLTVNPNLDTI